MANRTTRVLVETGADAVSWSAAAKAFVRKQNPDAIIEWTQFDHRDPSGNPVLTVGWSLPGDETDAQSVDPDPRETR